MATYNNKVWVVGGITWPCVEGKVAHGRNVDAPRYLVARFDLTTRHWTMLSPLSTAKTRSMTFLPPTPITADGLMVLVGGTAFPLEEPIDGGLYANGYMVGARIQVRMG